MKYLKQKIILLLLCGVSLALHAQQSTVSSGGEASGSGGSVSYTVGQVAYTTSTGTSGTVTQGEQQPFEISEVTGISVTNIILKMSVYPNPTTDVLQLKVERDIQENMSCQLFDINGKLLKTQNNLAIETQIEMSEYKQGVYFLKIIENNKQIKTFKIIKK
ncbi:MAG: T9SS type A sorting domain-containing protein [Salinivirgaceae bacterium]|nr:T9SS type A sorting domain-containing protein [Salinivirgaceae bacterium]